MAKTADTGVVTFLLQMQDGTKQTRVNPIMPDVVALIERREP